MTCVHCGFCLQACPTYLALGDENDSPRGRILLARALVEGTLPLDDPDVRTHLDRCLGCRGCETACPSGVPYGHILEAARATLNTIEPPPRLARIVLAVFARPRLLALALAGARVLRLTGVARLLARLPGRAGFAFAMLAASAPRIASRPYATRPRDIHGSVAVLAGCVMRGLFAHVNRATERVLAANGYPIVSAPGQRCCGALHAHTGDLAGAAALARRNIAAFEQSGAEYIAVNASGCGLMIKEYGHLLADDPAWAQRAAAIAARARDASELLADAGPVPGAPIPQRVAYDAPCHLLHGQHLARQPLMVLAAIPSLDVTPLPNADQCCGSAGIYSLVQPQLAQDVLAPKLAEIARAGAP
ncbi:MAG TPA: heterodisulfide reductase-related iron-sulfur binding cluster, partial [Gemmatimonadaceae bacterium]|nr:heterodisulfide reductase-related iron-sulfur binding cluster [Gemmatimonadaceae bacterium]